MRTAKRISQAMKATSLDDAFELSKEFADQHRLPPKRVAELMGVEYKTLMRWMLDGTMPINKLLQFEHITKSQFISEYLCVFQGNKIAIDIPRGKKSSHVDLAEIQSQWANMFMHLSKFYEGKVTAEETIAEINESLTNLAFQRENVKKTETPELALGGEDE